MTTKVLLVHGMGRTPLSMWRLARTLRRAGLATEGFGYVAAWQPVSAIVDRLRARLEAMADGDYVVIGHSLGGLLLRAAVATLPRGVPRPQRIIMLATPNHSPRLARRFEHAWWYRISSYNTYLFHFSVLPHAHLHIVCTFPLHPHSLYPP